MRSIEEAIKWYKKEKINIIPLQCNGKKPVGSWKKYQTTQITDEEIDIFFNKSKHNLGAVCGAISDNLFVLDFDTEEIFSKFFKKTDDLIYVQTGRGFHVYFKAEEPVKPLKCFDSEGREILTLKSEGGYVVGVGSTHSSGKIYELMNSGSIPVLEGNVREEMKAKALKVGLNFGNIEKSEEVDIEFILRGTPRGGQDNAIMHLSHYLRRQGLSFEEAYSIIQSWSKICKPIIPEHEIYEKLKTHYALPEPYSFFYKTNPTKMHIMKDLTLQRTDAKESVNASDLYDVTDRGVKTIDRDRTCDYIENKYHFKSLRGTHILYMYRDGVYMDEEGRLDEIIQRLFGGDATIRVKQEIRKQIEDRNQIEGLEMNDDKFIIPVKNGLLNIDTMTLEPFTYNKLFTAGLDVFYDPEVRALPFEKAVREILPGSDFFTMQELFGYCLWRDYPVSKSFWLIGEGGNGKTMLMNVLSAFLRSSNVTHITLDEFDGQHRFSMFELFGKLANIIPEPSTSRKMESALFKAATGKDELIGEMKGRQKRFFFISFAKQIIYANSLPQIADEKRGLWDRILPIEFPVSFRNSEHVNVNLAEELSTPGSLTGILNWALKGLSRLRENKWQFTNSPMQEEIKTTMQIGSNSIAAFRDSWLTFSRDGETPAQYLYDAFNMFSFVYGIPEEFKGVITKEIQKDNRIKLHRIRREGRRIRVFKGCTLSNSIIACYGWYRDSPLHPGELDNIEEPENEVEVRTCSLQEYLEHYLEPAEEVQEIIDEKQIIFNTEELIELYKAQKGTMKHIGPRAIDKEVYDENTTILKPITPLEEGLCEDCGSRSFLTHERTDEDGKKSLVCLKCADAIESEAGITKPKIFGTTLEQRREGLNKKGDIK